MPIPRRSAGRFFAAFYDWSCLAQRPHYTSRSFTVQPNGGWYCQSQSSRSLTTTRIHQTSEGQLRANTEEDGRIMSIGSSGGEAISSDTKILSNEEMAQNKKGSIEQERSRNNAPEELQHSLRTLMRRVTHPIVVLTAASADTEGNAEPVGMAISSFNTVTLHPPTISFNIQSPSRTLTAIRDEGGNFLVHFLPPSLKSAVIADAFTWGNGPSALANRKDVLNDGQTPASSKIPNDQVAAYMSCKIVKELDVADHVIIAAEVLDIQDCTTSAAPFLTYVNGHFIDKRGRLFTKENIKELSLKHRSPSQLNQTINASESISHTTKDNKQARDSSSEGTMFKQEISLELLEDRVRQFVRTRPIQAATWQSAEILAALNMAVDAHVTTEQGVMPSTSARIVSSLIRKACGEQLPHLNGQERQVVAAYLRRSRETPKSLRIIKVGSERFEWTKYFAKDFSGEAVGFETVNEASDPGHGSSEAAMKVAETRGTFEEKPVVPGAFQAYKLDGSRRS
ncbi:hypothetical protein BU24DRAFT_491395 [Aaosphaeria arxii CBS 175.79]|uniref:Flavin reductase like domain-containing protein n=1 Tax=Aaosphaeria arxii CBS 175.79 TaxID=1450172 RepID=A0A6A5XZ18_9PLEO|nr:uncharacterized protein BU24DRAFT_491395 [Aaosphaeria arxii CBS 175.79]KAF2018432.1 hypothetical protein BU24DRAFT_491395 [Aaosphaeria arxii CBS 175.79]